MAYELFKRTSVRVEQPTLGFAPDGRIALNAAAVRLFMHARITSVLLLWDKASNKIALKAASKSDKNAYAVSATRRQSGTLAAKSFFAYIGWRATERVLTDATWSDKEKMLEVTLPSECFGPAKITSDRRRKA